MKLHIEIKSIERAMSMQYIHTIINVFWDTIWDRIYAIQDVNINNVGMKFETQMHFCNLRWQCS